MNAPWQKLGYNLEILHTKETLKNSSFSTEKNHPAGKGGKESQINATGRSPAKIYSNLCCRAQ